MRQTAAIQPPAGEIILTYDDYAAIPNDGKRYEIIEGDFFVTPAPVPQHQKMIGRLYFFLARYLEDHPLGDLYLAPIDLILSHINVVQPDILFLSNKKRPLVSERGIEGPPDLIVEVLSPSTEKNDRTLKSRLYARCGVSHYWLIDLSTKRFEMFRLSGQRYSFSQITDPWTAPEDLFPGLSFPLSDLWR